MGGILFDVGHGTAFRRVFRSRPFPKVIVKTLRQTTLRNVAAVLGGAGDWVRLKLMRIFYTHKNVHAQS